MNTQPLITQALRALAARQAAIQEEMVRWIQGGCRDEEASLDHLAFEKAEVERVIRTLQHLQEVS